LRLAWFLAKQTRLVGKLESRRNAFIYTSGDHEPANERKVAFVTGLKRRIGWVTAQLGQQGVRVIVSARTEREPAEAASKLCSEGIKAEA
jgi:hypothetical protein